MPKVRRPRPPVSDEQFIKALRRKDVRSRVEHALKWVTRFNRRPAEIPAQSLANYLGSHTNPVGQYLRTHLLRVTRNYYNGAGVDMGVEVRCNEYELNRPGWKKVHRLLKRERQQPAVMLSTSPKVSKSRQFLQQVREVDNIISGRRVERGQCLKMDTVGEVDNITACTGGSPEEAMVGIVSPCNRSRVAQEVRSGVFTYTDRSHRLWHDLQRLPRQVKRTFWAPYLPHDYDISACAPTILLQLAERRGLLPILAGPINDYLANKDQFRAHLQDLTGLSEPVVKRLINSWFNGAKLARSRYTAFYTDLLVGRSAGQASLIVERLQRDRQVSSLRLAIRLAWNRLGRQYRTSGDKWNLYFQHERQVLDAVVEYLTDRGIKHFTEHDGWRTDQPVDVTELQQHIKDRTNFTLLIEEAT